MMPEKGWPVGAESVGSSSRRQAAYGGAEISMMRRRWLIFQMKVEAHVLRIVHRGEKH